MIPMPIELLCLWLLLQKKLHNVNTFVRRTYNLLQIESLLFAKMGEKGAHQIRLSYVSFIHETNAFFAFTLFGIIRASIENGNKIPFFLILFF